jgi:tetratricopeptide (TPR) repeat protein
MRYFALFGFVLALAVCSTARSQQITSNTSAPIPTSPAITTAASEELRADILMARKEYVSAINFYQASLKDNPNNAMVLNKIGVAYQQLSGYNMAANFYKQSAKADKKLSNPVNNLGTIEYQQQHYRKAISFYKRAIALGASPAPIYSNLGYAYFASKKYELAMDSFNKAVAIDPTVFEHHEGTGGSILQQRSSTDPAMFNFFLAKTYAKAGDAEKTARYLKLSRDYGYKNFKSVAKDPDFALVIKDPRVQDILLNRPPGQDPGPDAAQGSNKPAAN